jgi:chemotaxis-related protein WspD
MSAGAAQEPVACWNCIGVWGNSPNRCPKLDEVVHCRNCKIFSDSGRTMLDRDVDAGYLSNWAATLSQHKREIKSADQTVVVFRLGDECMALPAKLFNEVTEICKIHRVPHRSNNTLLGLTNIRGELKICVSLGNLLGLEKGQMTDAMKGARTYERIAVVEKDHEEFVFPVSEVIGILRYHPSDLEDAPSTVANARARYTTGILNFNGTHVAVLDDELLFYTLHRSLS